VWPCTPYIRFERADDNNSAQLSPVFLKSLKVATSRDGFQYVRSFQGLNLSKNLVPLWGKVLSSCAHLEALEVTVDSLYSLFELLSSSSVSAKISTLKVSHGMSKHLTTMGLHSLAAAAAQHMGSLKTLHIRGGRIRSEVVSRAKADFLNALPSNDMVELVIDESLGPLISSLFLTAILIELYLVDRIGSLKRFKNLQRLWLWADEWFDMSVHGIHSYDSFYDIGETKRMDLDEIGQKHGSLAFWSSILDRLRQLLPGDMAAKAMFYAEVDCVMDWQCDSEIYAESLLHLALKNLPPIEFVDLLSEFVAAEGGDKTYWLAEYDWAPIVGFSSSGCQSPFDSLVSSHITTPQLSQKLYKLLQAANPDVLARNRLVNLIQSWHVHRGIFDLSIGSLLDASLQLRSLKLKHLKVLFCSPLYGYCNILFSLDPQDWELFLVEPLMSRFGIDINSQENEQMRTLLHVAISRQSLVGLQHVLKHRPDLGLRDTWNQRPIDLAVQNLHLSYEIFQIVASESLKAGLSLPEPNSIREADRLNIAEVLHAAYSADKSGFLEGSNDMFQLLQLVVFDDIVEWLHVATRQSGWKSAFDDAIDLFRAMKEQNSGAKIVLNGDNVKRTFLSIQAALRTKVPSAHMSLKMSELNQLMTDYADTTSW
jgi:hypothetical protein